jgi:hypothetical protein
VVGSLRDRKGEDHSSLGPDHSDAQHASAAVSLFPARTQGPALHERAGPALHRVGPLLVSVPGTGKERNAYAEVRHASAAVPLFAARTQGPALRCVPGTGSERTAYAEVQFASAAVPLFSARTPRDKLGALSFVEWARSGPTSRRAAACQRAGNGIRANRVCGGPTCECGCSVFPGADARSGPT